MRLTRTMIYQKFLRNIQSVGVTADTNLNAEFNYQLGVYYQLMLAKLKNYKTYMSSTFLTGMNVTLLSTGVTQAISSITSSGTTATVTTGIAHGYSSGNSVSINNANPLGFNGTYTITVLTTTTFTYTLAVSLLNASATNGQYITNPPGYITADGITLTVGTINYPLRLISSQYIWEQMNIVPIQVAVPPRFFFPRRDDFGIFPIPQTMYTGNIYYHYRDRNLMLDDYTAGSIAVTNGSTLVVGTTTAFTAAMVGRWLEITDLTVPGQGYWYRISGFTDSTHITLSSAYSGTTTSGITSYIIGECPEIPEDLHMCLPDGITAGYLKDIRKDATNAQMFLNSFYTGDLSNSSRKEDDDDIIGGLIGGMKNYSDREDERIITRNDQQSQFAWEPWGVHLKAS